MACETFVFRLALLCWAVAAAAQTAPIVIDAKLSDAIWKDVAATPLTPSQPGVQAGMGGEIRAVVAGRYLLVAARLPESTGHFTARLTGRNPSWEDEDALRILAGANIGYTDRIVQINPLGAYSVEKAVHATYRNQSVFPYVDEWQRDVVYRDAEKFLVAASAGEKEWNVEVAIPLNELSAPGSDRIFVGVERIRAARPGSPRQSWHWPEHGPAAKVSVSRLVKWDGPAPVFRPALLGNTTPPLEVGRARALPPLDAGWNDEQWRDVPAWHLLRDEPMARRPRFPTEVKLLHDGRRLAVFAKCTEPGAAQASVKEHDGPVNQDDSFQVYLATSGSAYTQFAINPLGFLLDSVGFTGGQRVSRAREWQSGAQVAVRQEHGAWTARIDIPLDGVAQALGETGFPSEWRILLSRYRAARDGEPRVTSVLPVIESETLLCPSRYRRLALVEGKPAGVQAPSKPFASDVFSPTQRKQMDLAGMLGRHIRGRVLPVLQAEKRDRDEIKTKADWERFRNPRMKALQDFIGSFPARTPLQTRVTKEYAGQGYRRQDLVYQSRPGLWVTANLYLPSKSVSRMPGFVIIHSHHRPRTQAELQDMGILWARAGCAVLIMDQIGHGERLQTYPWNREAYHSRYVMGMQLYLAGESLIQWMVWDIMRGVDLLLERPDIHREQIILLGAVAAGGDPAAVAAALDNRIAAVAPFNFGEATPRNGAGKSSWPDGLADPGSGSWESTRNMPGSIANQFLQWVVCASIAPRRFIYSYEMGWDVERQPAWERYRKLFGFYGPPDQFLGEAHGFGTFPGPGECANIGPAQRATLYTSLHRWFGIPIPAREPDDRRPEAELASLTPAVASELRMRSIHELAREVAIKKLNAARQELAKLPSAARRDWLRAKWSKRLGDIEPNPRPEVVSYWKRPWRNAAAEAIALQVEPGIVVPVLMLRPSSKARTPVVVAVAEGGKAGFLDYRTAEIEALVASGTTVCLPDVRGTGETSPDSRRDPNSAGISLAATEWMLGSSVVGARLKDLRTVLAYLAGRDDIDASRIAAWGDSFSSVNPQQGLFDEMAGWQIGPRIQHRAEPLGGLLAILAALYEDRVRAAAVRNGLAAYVSILDDSFAYVPADVIMPGILEGGDLPDVAAALTPMPLLLEGLVDGKNRALQEQSLRSSLALVYDAYRGSASQLIVRPRGKPAELVLWLTSNLGRTSP